jgi:hypothetical protein
VAAVLADLMDARRDATEPAPGTPGAAGQVVDIPTLVLPDFEPQITSAEELRQSLADIATETIGEYLPDSIRDQIVAKLQGRETDLQRQQYDRDVARVREQYDMEVAGVRQRAGATAAGQGGAAATEIDAFLAALSGQESGGDYTVPNKTGSGAYGKYQIMPGNWASWSRRAGLPPGSPQTPANQEIVARQIVGDYFAQFGNWRDVAVAWYSGPGGVASKRYSTRAQKGGPSISRYADEVMARMAAVRRGTQSPNAVPGTVEIGGGTVGGRSYGPIENFDPVAEAQAAIKAADPVGWEANEWGKRANEFFTALGGILSGAS